MYFQLSSFLCFNISNLFIFSLDLMSSPRNPLNQRVLERTAATFFIIFIVNQLFISNNDIIELDWLEREFFATDRAKWDGVLIKVENRSCSAGLIEFSGGGCNDQTSSTKNQRDITKLYSKLMKVLDSQSSSAARQTFCMRYYSKIRIYSQVFYAQLLFFFFSQQINVFTLRSWPFTKRCCSEPSTQPLKPLPLQESLSNL